MSTRKDLEFNAEFYNSDLAKQTLDAVDVTTRNHFRKLGEIVRSEGILNALSYDIGTTVLRSMVDDSPILHYLVSGITTICMLPCILGYQAIKSWRESELPKS